METPNLTTVIRNDVNYSLTSFQKINKHLQTGKRILDGVEDSGELGKLIKLESGIKTRHAKSTNLQNALSFVQKKDGALKVLGNILSRSAELKTFHQSLTANESDKENYDKEFKELQFEIKKMLHMKHNGVSLFAYGQQQNLVTQATDPNSLFVDSSTNSNIEIKRSGVFELLQISEPAPAPDTDSRPGGNRGAAEYRVNVPLKASSGVLEWTMDVGTAQPDAFTAYHGSEQLYDHAFSGGPGTLMTNLKTYSPANGNMTINPSGTRPDGKVNIPFGRNGNNSSTIDLVVNEGGRVGGQTNFDWKFKITYDPIEKQIGGDGPVYSLADFTMEEMTGFINVLANARAQAGSEESRLKSEIQHLYKSQINHEQAIEKTDGLDYAKAIGQMTISKDRMEMSAKLMSVAIEMENRLFTDLV